MRKCAVSVAVSLSIILPSTISANNSLQPINDVTLSEPPPPWEARPDVDPEAYNNADSTSVIRQKSAKTERVEVPVQVQKPVVDSKVVTKPATNTQSRAFESVPKLQNQVPVSAPVAASANENSIENWYEKRRNYKKQNQANSLSDWQQQARAGDSDAQYQLGLALQQGVNGKANIYEAINWFTKAANSGHKDAQYALALIYQSNASTAEDERKFVTWLKKAAEHNHVGAQYYLGMMYANGEQVAKDPKMARKWFEKAGQSGHIAAKIALAEIVDSPKTKQTQEVKKVQPKLAKSQVKPAQVFRTDKEVLEAESPLSLEDNMPPPVSMYPETSVLQDEPINVSALPNAETKIVRKGEPIESIEVASVAAPPATAAVTSPEAIKVASIAPVPMPKDVKAKQQPIEAIVPETKETPQPAKEDKIKQKQSAKKTSQPIKEVPQVSKQMPDVAKIRADAEAGDSKAQLILGTLFEDGTGNLSQDYESAIKWYRLSADQGYAKAQYNLGLLYEDGKGVSQDFYEAAQWYKRAANNGFAEAQNNLGVLYIMGKGVIQDKARAELMFRKSAEQGNKNAQRNLEMLLSEA